MGMRQREERRFRMFRGEGLETDFAEGDTTGAPTEAECAAAFGAATTKEEGWFAFFQDTHSGGVLYLVVTDGATYFTIASTAAA